MAIVYRTSDMVTCEEIDPRTSPRNNPIMQGEIVAPYLRGAVGELGTESGSTFAVYTVSTANLHYAIVAAVIKGDALSSEPDRILYIRAWQVAEALLVDTVKQLLRNRGVLDHEVKRVALVTNNFTYSTIKDVQKQRLYDTEDRLPNPAATSMNYSRGKRVIAEQVNNSLNLQPTDLGYIMSKNEAAEFGEQVFEHYGIDDIRLESGVSGFTAAAQCSLRNLNSDSYFHKRLFYRDYDMVLGFSPLVPICRGVILHEIAHALDVREYGGFCHGPTFVLLYAELIGKFTSVNFATAFDTFVNAGLKVANPIHSDQFYTLPKWRRHAFRISANEQREALSRRLSDEI